MTDSSTVKPIKISNAFYLKRFLANTFALASNLQVWERFQQQVKSKYLIAYSFLRIAALFSFTKKGSRQSAVGSG